jgi:hypothetical protein
MTKRGFKERFVYPNIPHVGNQADESGRSKMKHLAVIKAVLTSAAFASFAVATSAHAAFNKEVQIINRSGESIYAFYASHVYDDDWGDDRLGLTVLGSNRRITFDMDDGQAGCMYDFKTIMANGQEVIRRNVDVCSVSRYTIG